METTKKNTESIVITDKFVEVAKSLQPNFKSLSDDDKVKAIMEDIEASKNEFGGIFKGTEVISEEGSSALELVQNIDKQETIEEATKWLQKLVALGEKYNIPAYKIMISVIGTKAFDLLKEKEENALQNFIKKFLLDYASSNTKEEEKAVVVRTEEAAAACDCTGFNANRFVNNSVPIDNGTLTAMWNQNNQMYPPMDNMIITPQKRSGKRTVQQKADLLKTHINFIDGKHNVTESQVDALLKLVETPWLSCKLKECNSKCNPDYPTMIEVEVDDPVINANYDFVFTAETNIEGKIIVVLFNSNTFVNQFNMPVNNASLYLEDEDKIIK